MHSFYSILTLWPDSRRPDLSTDHVLPGSVTSILSPQSPASSSCQTCSENLGLRSCSSLTVPLWVWNVEIQAKVSDDALRWEVGQSVSGRMKYTYLDSSGTPVTIDQPFSIPDDHPDSSYLQQINGQKLIFWLDAPGSVSHTSSGTAVQSLTHVMNFESRVCSSDQLYQLNKDCFKVAWYLKFVAAGTVLDFINSKAGLGSLPDIF